MVASVIERPGPDTGVYTTHYAVRLPRTGLGRTVTACPGLLAWAGTVPGLYELEVRLTQDNAPGRLPCKVDGEWFRAPGGEPLFSVPHQLGEDASDYNYFTCRGTRV